MDRSPNRSSPGTRSGGPRSGGKPAPQGGQPEKGMRSVFEIRNVVFEHLSRLSFYDRARSGDLMSRVTADVDAINTFIGRAAVIVLTNVLTRVGIFVVLLRWDWRLALVYLACIPLIGMSVYATRVARSPIYRRLYQRQWAG